jgi:outer membrane protein assembly factor BamB
MSVLFVWPAALFSLLIWWTFFSGWSAKVRFGLVGLGIAGLVAFFSIFRLERFDGDMTPTRIVLRWSKSADQKARQYIETLQVRSGNPATAPQEAEPLEADENDWPGYRGQDRSGIVTGVTLRTDWENRRPTEVWRHPVGRAWSSFAVVGDYAFTQEQRGDSESVVAYRFSNGEQVWEHRDEVQFVAATPQGGPGPRSTPQFSGGKLYSLGGTGLLNCLDPRTGKVHWSTNILKDAGDGGQPAANLEWGMSGSPLVVDNLVVVIPGGKTGSSVVAYHKDTGEKVWKTGDWQATYASPVIATLGGDRTVLAPLGPGLAGLDLGSGREKWFFPWTNAPLVCGAMPVALDDHSVLYGIGYGVGTVRLDVQRSGESWTVHQQWQSNRFRPKFNDFVIRDGNAYGLDDGTLTCLNLETGQVRWKSGRYGYGQVLLVGDVLLIVSEKGTVFQIPAQPEKPSELTSFQALDENEITWNQPVLIRGKLLVRNANEAACFDLE